MVGKNAPGDQLLAIVVVPKAGATNEYEVQAIAQTAGADAAAPRTVVALPAGVEVGIVRLSVGPTRSGQRAGLALGYSGQPAPPKVSVLKGDGEVVSTNPLNKGEVRAWRCLTVAPPRSELTVATMEPPAPGATSPSWQAVEFREDGSRAYDARMT